MIIGITGGIGSGKSTVCSVFKTLNISVYNTDLWAKYLINNNEKIKTELIHLLGEKTYINNNYNKPYVAKLIFNDEKLLLGINNIVHSAVNLHFNEWHKKQKQAKYVIKESALIFESKINSLTDKIITVTAPEELRIKRVMQRDNLTKQQVEDRIKNQLSDDYKIANSDYVIYCDDNQLVIPQIMKIHNNILKSNL